MFGVGVTLAPPCSSPTLQIARPIYSFIPAFASKTLVSSDFANRQNGLFFSFLRVTPI
jgi:hypothetical protein